MSKVGSKENDQKAILQNSNKDVKSVSPAMVIYNLINFKFKGRNSFANEETKKEVENVVNNTQIVTPFNINTYKNNTNNSGAISVIEYIII